MTRDVAQKMQSWGNGRQQLSVPLLIWWGYIEDEMYGCGEKSWREDWRFPWRGSERIKGRQDSAAQ